MNSTMTPNHTVDQTKANRFAQSVFLAQWWCFSLLFLALTSGCVSDQAQSDYQWQQMSPNCQSPTLHPRSASTSGRAKKHILISVFAPRALDLLLAEGDPD
jgi:hypothetical protein